MEPLRKGSYLSRKYIGTIEKKRVRTLGTKGSELKESALSELRFRTIVKRFRTVKKKLWNHRDKVPIYLESISEPLEKKRVRTLGTKGSELKESALSELRFRTIVKRFRTVKKKLWNHRDKVPIYLESISELLKRKESELSELKVPN